MGSITLVVVDGNTSQMEAESFVQTLKEKEFPPLDTANGCNYSSYSGDDEIIESLRDHEAVPDGSCILFYGHGNEDEVSIGESATLKWKRLSELSNRQLTFVLMNCGAQNVDVQAQGQLKYDPEDLSRYQERNKCTFWIFNDNVQWASTDGEPLLTTALKTISPVQAIALWMVFEHFYNKDCYGRLFPNSPKVFHIGKYVNVLFADEKTKGIRSSFLQALRSLHDTKISDQPLKKWGKKELVTALHHLIAEFAEEKISFHVEDRSRTPRTAVFNPKIDKRHLPRVLQKITFHGHFKSDSLTAISQLHVKTADDATWQVHSKDWDRNNCEVLVQQMAEAWKETFEHELTFELHQENKSKKKQNKNKK